MAVSSVKPSGNSTDHVPIELTLVVTELLLIIHVIEASGIP